MQRINPEVWTRAALFTDGRITDQLLRDVAAMNRLPLYVEQASYTPDPIETAAKAVRNAEAGLAELMRCYVVARADQRAANRYRPGHHARSNAFATLNRRRAQLRAADRRLAEARAALDAARIAAELGNVIPFRNAA